MIYCKENQRQFFESVEWAIMKQTNEMVAVAVTTSIAVFVSSRLLQKDILQGVRNGSFEQGTNPAVVVVN
jgi:hypothetical protein